MVGEVALDAEDVAGELAVLRRTASSLEPGGVRAKVLVPNEQIKYLTIATLGMDDAARLDAAKGALDGATPYAVDELAFDISVDGDQTHIAAVARETLAEAEAFAVEHRFHPVSFAAIPADQPYLGEPYFGPTATAQELLQDGEKVEPDGIAVVVIGDVTSAVAVAAEPKTAPVQETEIETSEAVEKTATKDHAAPEDAVLKDTVPKVPAPSAAPAPEPEGKGDVAPDAPNAKEPEKAAISNAPTSVPDALAPSPSAAEPNKTAAPEATAKPDAPATAEAKPKTAPPPAQLSATPPSKPATPLAPTLGAASRGTAAPSLPEPGVSVSPAPAEAKTTNVPTAGFASRRGADAPATSTGLPGARREPSLGTPNAPASAVPSPGMSVSDPSVPELGGKIKPDSSSLAPQMTNAAPQPKARFLSRRKSKAAAPVKALPQRQINPAVAGTMLGSEAERMTVFGARRADVGGKPRFLGLILTAALLVFLAGVAAWASVFLDDGISLSRLFGDRSPRATASTPDTPEKTTPEGIQTASLDPGLTEEDGAVLDALRDPIEPPVKVMTEAEAEAKYAATGIWPRAPQVPPEPAALIDIEDLYVTSIDPVSTSSDAVALPSADGYLTDVAFGSVSSPAAAGTQFAYDARGLVVPTAQGALSPDGFTVFLGRPALVPTAFPDRSEAVPEDNTASDALAKLRPLLRPGDLAETTERAQLDGLTRSELAGFRPLLRPQSVQQQAAAAQAPVAETPTVDTTDAVAAALAAVPAPSPAIENATKFAVKASIRPDTRPRNFARIVKRAQRAAPEPQETQVASAAAMAPKVVAPKIPSNASVARQATVKNAINLRKVNLIGVYGKPSNRRALVRLSNGRYKKVVVGDRIDGGRVSAIGDSELRYTKRGRNIVLKMPKG